MVPTGSSGVCRQILSVTAKSNFSFPSSGQHRTEEFRKVNVLMKVPALRDGSFTLAER